MVRQIESAARGVTVKAVLEDVSVVHAFEEDPMPPHSFESETRYKGLKPIYLLIPEGYIL